jgi:serine/threonine-protein kinase
MHIGVPPFRGASPSPIALAMQHMTATVPSVRAAQPDVPHQLERVLWRALAKDPDARYPTGAALSEALRRAWEGCER